MNCHRNYPWYRDWLKKFPKDFRIIGIHTPETKAERDSASVARRAKDARLEFPILIDNDHSNWKAWGNRVWPSVYLVDKKGYIRCWWFGELNWREAKGQEIVGKRIKGLLSEGADK